eukprot:scaffold12132_cov153-Skeletonema_menzelii.AAC.5
MRAKAKRYKCSADKCTNCTQRGGVCIGMELRSNAAVKSKIIASYLPLYGRKCANIIWIARKQVPFESAPPNSECPCLVKEHKAQGYTLSSAAADGA